MTPLRIALGVFALLVVGLLAWGLAREAWDDAHAIDLANAAACPKLSQVSVTPERFCQASMEVMDQVQDVVGHQPCACDGPGYSMRVGSAPVVLGSRAWATCVVRGPAMMFRVTSTHLEGSYQVPSGWTGFVRASAEGSNCRMLPDARIDSGNPRRLLDRARWPGSR